MPNNLEQKLRMLLKEIEGLGEADQVRALMRLIEAELGLQKSRYFVSVYDLTAIRSRAISILNNTPTNREIEGELVYHDPENFRTMCYTQAVMEFLRGKGFTSNDLGFREKKTERTFCNHQKADLDIENPKISFICRDCKAKILPVMWKEIDE